MPSNVTSINQHGEPPRRRWWHVARLLLLLVAVPLPVQATARIAVVPSGTATWPQMLRRDPAIVQALGGRRRAIPFFLGSPRAIGGPPAVPLPVTAPGSPAGPGGAPLAAAPASSPTLATSF